MNRQLAASVRYHAAYIALARKDSRNYRRHMLAGWHFDDAHREAIKRTERAVMIHAAAKAVVIAAAIVAAYNVLRWFFA